MGIKGRIKRNDYGMKTLLTFILAGLIYAVPLCASVTPKQDEKARIRMRFDYFKTEQSEYLTVRVTGRLERRYEPVDGIGVSIYLAEDTVRQLIGKIITDETGAGQLELQQDFRDLTSDLLTMNFEAVLDSTPIYEDKSETLTIHKVDMDLSYNDQDSIKNVIVQVLEKDSTGTPIPQEGVYLKFYVERPLANLPIGETLNKTDEMGKAEIEFPNDLPGDSEGNVRLIVRIEDNDKYGNVEISDHINWGVPTEIDREEVQRSLWASGANAPILLMLLVNSLIFAVWGIIIYIVVKIFRISKI